MPLIVTRKRIVPDPQQPSRLLREKDVLCFDQQKRTQYWMGREACELLDYVPARTFTTHRGAALAAEIMGGNELEELAQSVN